MLDRRWGKQSRRYIDNNDIDNEKSINNNNNDDSYMLI